MRQLLFLCFGECILRGVTRHVCSKYTKSLIKLKIFIIDFIRWPIDRKAFKTSLAYHIHTHSFSASLAKSVALFSWHF